LFWFSLYYFGQTTRPPLISFVSLTDTTYERIKPMQLALALISAAPSTMLLPNSEQLRLLADIFLWQNHV